MAFYQKWKLWVLKEMFDLSLRLWETLSAFAIRRSSYMHEMLQLIIAEQVLWSAGLVPEEYAGTMLETIDKSHTAVNGISEKLGPTAAGVEALNKHNGKSSAAAFDPHTFCSASQCAFPESPANTSPSPSAGCSSYVRGQAALSTILYRHPLNPFSITKIGNRASALVDRQLAFVLQRSRSGPSSQAKASLCSHLSQRAPPWNSSLELSFMPLYSTSCNCRVKAQSLLKCNCCKTEASCSSYSRYCIWLQDSDESDGSISWSCG